MGKLNTISKTMIASCIVAVTAGAFTSNALAQTSNDIQTTEFSYWPGVNYNANIPTTESILGYKVGERITSHADLIKYFEALASAAPDNIKLVKYGETWEGRALIYAVVGSAEHLANLDAFASNMQKLSDPKSLGKGEANQIIASLPSSVWLQHGVHGNEISSTDAAIQTAYHLLAAPEDPVNKTILSNTLVFIDPLQNPDGRSRFISHYYATVGMVHSDDRLSAEHNEPWPRGRSNHYLFDMNRDWLAITQPETAGRIKAINHFKPTVVIDLHEMGGDDTYFFVPAAQPINPYMQPDQLANNDIIGKNNARHFDDFGFSYFTREVFDGFYPGYGDSWPTFYGASAATYEVASTRGEIYKTRTGEIKHYRDTVQRHFVAALSTAQATAENRKKILTDFYDYQVEAIEAGENDKKERSFILPNTRDVAGTHRLATLMAKHGVIVKQATEDFKACGERYQAGAYIIDTAQPRGRFVKTTFTEQVDMPQAFVDEQERRRARKLRDEIYDVTGWSLPLMFNIDTARCGKAVEVKSRLVDETDKLVQPFINPAAKVAYLVPWGDMAAGRLLTAALQAGISLKSADEAFTLEGVNYPAGTLVIERHANASSLPQTMLALSEQTGAKIVGVDTSWVTKGPSFGSEKTVHMTAPKIAMAWDEPTSSLSAGNTRFVIEQQFNYPVTAIRADRLQRADLSQYQVLILPSGNYSRDLGKTGAENLAGWVSRGGVLITMSDATQWASSEGAGLLDAKRELAYSEDGTTSEKDSDLIDGQLIESKADLILAIENDTDMPDSVAGVLAKVEVDQEHWLTAGVNPEVIAMVYGNDIYSPVKLESGENVAWFKSKEDVLASGYLWEENKAQLAYKPFLIHQPLGRGMVIAFTQEPTTRAYLDGLNVMFLNAIFRSAAHAEPVR